MHLDIELCNSSEIIDYYVACIVVKWTLQLHL